MQEIIWQSLSLFFMILLGFLMKRVGLLQKSDGTLLARVIMNITLPAVIIVNFMDLTIDRGLLLFIAIALVWYFVQLTSAYFYARKKDAMSKALFMYGASGFNIGNFTLPFVQSVAPLGIPLVSMFDVGNNLLLSGGNKIVIDQVIGHSHQVRLKQIGLQLAKSIPFSCYLIMFLFSYFSVEIPHFVMTLATPVASANVFLSMFMIGLYLEFRLPKAAIKEIIAVLALRYGIGFFVIGLLAFLPVSDLTKSMLSLLALTPIPLFGIMFAVSSGVKEEVLGFAASISFLLSLPLMTLVLLIYR
ncbi:AEC family transporter [Enterococcus sp. LJL98]